VDIAATVAEIKSLSIDERLAIVEAIWDSIVTDDVDNEVTQTERELIERRLAAYLARTNDAVAWEEVKARALDRVRA
jgi:putative addiction module component (TIGR02574 family)